MRTFLPTFAVVTLAAVPKIAPADARILADATTGSRANVEPNMRSIADSLFFLSVPGLRPTDIDPRRTSTLYAWANRGALADLVPTFPCVTSCVQASMETGTPPEKHGVIANGFYHREKREVEFWVAHNHVITGEPIWDALRARRPGLTSAVWHVQNIKGASADFIVTPAPIHEPDGSTKLWCYSKPDGLYARLLAEIGHFPLQHYWGPLSNIESTRWILRAAAWLHDRHAPNFHWIYIPHLDYAAQKFGPNSSQAMAALAELDAELARFADCIAASPVAKEVTWLVAGEYALTDVTGVIHPNRILRDANLLRVIPANLAGIQGGVFSSRGEPQHDPPELLDLQRSDAFAMVDHQLAHVFINTTDSQSREKIAARVVELFRDLPGIAGAFAGSSRAAVGMIHERSGDVILIADDAHWFAYYWWLDDTRAPAFARTVDIHRKPGYDPVELFFDPKTKGILLDAALVRGSHGTPAIRKCHNVALVCSISNAAVESGKTYRDTDMKNIVLRLMSAS